MEGDVATYLKAAVIIVALMSAWLVLRQFIA
jgi:hypothetical protein